MDLKGRIIQVEFEPNNYFRIQGWVNSKFNESRVCGEGTNEFSQMWSWFDSSMPPEIFRVYKMIMGKAEEDLQQRGIMPKKWPGVLDEHDGSADIFQFKIKTYRFSNPRWLSAKELGHSVTVTASSKWFTDNQDIEKDVILQRIPGDDLDELFTTLDKNL